MIGGYVVRGLLEKGHSVVGVDLRVNPNLNDDDTRLEQVVLDLGDKEAVERVFEGHRIESTPSQFLDRPLSKLKHDILEYLHII